VIASDVVVCSPRLSAAIDAQEQRGEDDGRFALSIARLREDTAAAQREHGTLQEQARLYFEENARLRTELKTVTTERMEVEVSCEEVQAATPRPGELENLRYQLALTRQALEETGAANRRLEESQSMGAIADLRRQLTEARAAESEAIRLRDELSREKSDFCAHLQQIERLVESMTTRETELSSQVETLTKEKEALALELSDARSTIDTRTSLPTASAVTDYTPRAEDSAPGGEEQCRQKSSMLMLQNQVEMSERKLRLADVENAMLRRQLLALRRVGTQTSCATDSEAAATAPSDEPLPAGAME